MCELPARGRTQTPLLRPHLYRFLLETPALGSLKPGFLRAPFPPRGSSPLPRTQSSVKASPPQPAALPCSQLDGPPGDHTDPAHLCSCYGTKARVRTHLLAGCIHMMYQFTCAVAQRARVRSTFRLPPTALSLLMKVLRYWPPHLAHFRWQLFPSAPSHPVST